MKILIHALGANMGGAMRHLTNFLPALGQADSAREYVVLVRGSVPNLCLADNIHLERVPDAMAVGKWRRIAADVIHIPRRLRGEKASAVVSLLNTGPIWSPVPHILFQRNSLYFSRYYLQRVPWRLKAETLLRRRLAAASMGRADLIVTPSDAMADMIRETCPTVSGRQFRTLRHGFSLDPLGEPLDRPYAERLAGCNGYRFVYPTHPGYHKGFEVLFEILAALKATGLRFKLFATISHEDWPAGVSAYETRVERLGLKDHVVFMGRVPQGQMGALYRACDLMIYPSLCESFGFSMIEAMGHGLPVVAADTRVNREMCAGGAIYYPALDSRMGAARVMEALHGDTMARLKEKGEKRLGSFAWGWTRYAKEFMDLIGEVV